MPASERHIYLMEDEPWENRESTKESEHVTRINARISRFGAAVQVLR